MPSRRNVFAWCSLFVLWSLLVLCCAPREVAPAPPRVENLDTGVHRSPPEQALAAVAVRRRCGDGSGWGSGVAVGGRYVLTAAHVTACAQRPLLLVYLAGGGVREARVVRADKLADLALIEAEGADLVVGRPAIGPVPPIDAWVCSVAAFPKAGWSCGQVSAVSGTASGADVTHGAEVRRGNSGAGVYDGAGRLVGVTVTMVSCGTPPEPCGGQLTSLARRAGFLP